MYALPIFVEIRFGENRLHCTPNITCGVTRTPTHTFILRNSIIPNWFFFTISFSSYKIQQVRCIVQTIKTRIPPLAKLSINRNTHHHRTKLHPRSIDDLPLTSKKPPPLPARPEEAIPQHPSSHLGARTHKRAIPAPKEHPSNFDIPSLLHLCSRWHLTSRPRV